MNGQADDEYDEGDNLSEVEDYPEPFSPEKKNMFQQATTVKNTNLQDNNNRTRRQNS